MASKHSYTAQERRSFAEHINRTMKDDRDLVTVLPLNVESDALFSAVADGVLLTKWLNKLKPGIIPERSFQLLPRNRFEKLQNQTNVLNAARELGLNIVNMGPEDLVDPKPHLVLGLIWQIVRLELLSKVTVKQHPEIVVLMEPNEEVETFLDVTPEVNLLRWFNYHLKKQGSPRRVTNFSSDLADSENYVVLLNSIAPSVCSLEILQEADPLARAQRFLVAADQIGCKQYLSPPDIVNGNWKLNLAFVANLFNKKSGIPFEPAFEERLRQINQALQHREALAVPNASVPASGVPVAANRAASDEAAAAAAAAARQRAAAEAARLRQLEEDQRRRDEEAARRKAMEQRAKEEARIRETQEREARWREAEQRRLAEEEARRLSSQWQAPPASYAPTPSISVDPFASMSYQQPPFGAAPGPISGYGLASSHIPPSAPSPYGGAAPYGAAGGPSPYGPAGGPSPYSASPYGAPSPYGFAPSPSFGPGMVSSYPVSTSIPVVGMGGIGVKPPISSLKVVIQEARALAKKDFFGLAASDPYCTIEVRGNVQKTRKCNSTRTPVWYEEFMFINVEPKDRVIISVWDSDSFKKDDFMGQVVLNYEDLAHPQERWYRLLSRPGSSDRVSGEIKIGVTPYW